MQKQWFYSWGKPKKLRTRDEKLTQPIIIHNDSFRPKGFTFLEVIIALLIVGIGMSLSVPAFTNLYDNLNLELDARTFAQTLKTARLAALTERLPFTVCPTEDNENCHHLGQNLLVFIDNNHNGRREPNEVLIKKVSLKRYTPRVEMFDALRHDYWFFIFLPNGFTLNNGTAYFANASRTLKVVIRNSGLVRLLADHQASSPLIKE